MAAQPHRYITYRFTCEGCALPDLDGQPASLHACTPEGLLVLHFDNGAWLEVPWDQVRLLKPDA